MKIDLHAIGGRLAAAALTATLATAVADGWRTAAIAAIAAGLTLATRVRFSAYAAIALLLTVAVVSAAGLGPRASQRRGLGESSGTRIGLGHHRHA